MAAKRSHVTQRNADFGSIIQKVSFVDSARAESAKASTVSGDDGSFGILEHDFVFWLGDLNYRIVEGISIEQVHERIEAGDLEFLRDRDQLNVERAAGRVFQLFHEAKLTFLPTYKYQVGTDVYERRPDKKHRAPAWCDRVLWRCNTSAPEEHVRHLVYNRSEENISDHKPVRCVFDVSVKTIVKERQRKVMNQIMRKLDKMENESIPRATLDRRVVHFPEVKYKQRSKQTVTVTNCGEVAAQWRFAPKLEEKFVSKGWLSIEPLFGMVLPGESEDINLYCYVEEDVGREVAHARDVLQDILILRLENGADFFITVTGQYMPSAFCLTAQELVQSVANMRECPIAKDRITSGANSASAKRRAFDSTPPPLQVPKELWRLVDFIFKRGMDTPGVCVASGLPEEMVRVREALDTGTPIDTSISVTSVAATLIELLRSFDDAVVPSSMFPRAEFGSVPISAWCRNLLQQLDVTAYNTFTYIVCFARELLQHASSNELTVPVAAEVFGRALMRAPLREDMDATAAAASTMTTATPLRSAGVTTAVAAGLAEALMTAEQVEAVTAVMTYFLTVRAPSEPRALPAATEVRRDVGVGGEDDLSAVHE